METNSLLTLSPAQLRRAAELKEKIDALNKEFAQLLGGEIPVPFGKGGATRKGGMSAEGRARIAAAARARWAKIKAAKGETADKSGPKKRTMSAAGRARIAAAQRARWAKQKAAK